MVENVKNEEYQLCDVHIIDKKFCTLCNKFICTSCILREKEEIKHYREHFDNIILKDLSSKNTYADKLHDYDGFELINKSFLSYIEKTEDLIESSSEKIHLNKELMKKTTKELLMNFYLRITENFEKTVKKVNSSINSLDIKDTDSKEEFKKIKQSLDDQSEYLDSEEKMNADFQKIIDGATKKFSRMKVADMVNEKFRFNIGKKGEVLDLIGCNSSIVESSGGRQGSYWCVKSEESFSGEFKAKVKVIKLDSTKANNYWGYTVGIIRKTSTVVDNYFNDSILFQANGYLANKFTSSGSYKKIFTTNWVAGDEIIVKRDSKSNLYFGVNNEEDLKLAFEGITGEFRLVIGMTSTSSGDSFELIEIES